METVNPIVRNALNWCEKPAPAGVCNDNGNGGGAAHGMEGDAVLARTGAHSLVRDATGAYWIYDGDGNGRKLDAPDGNAAAFEFRKLATLAANGAALRRAAAASVNSAPYRPAGVVWNVRG